DLQHAAENLIGDQLPTLRDNGASNAALVAIDPGTGQILALVGSANYADSSIQGQVNLATAERQPGSAIAPFVYLYAFDHRLATPATTLHDSPTQYAMGSGQPPYVPSDDDGRFRGAVSARHALATALTVPAVELLSRIGVGALLSTLHQFGITSLRAPADRYGLSLTLGVEPVSLLDLTYAYSTLAHGGVQVGEPVAGNAPDQSKLAPVAILKVTDVSGNVLDDVKAPSGVPVSSPAAAWLVTNILADKSGSLAPLDLAGRPTAARVATSANLRDSWTFGFTPQLAVGVWVGNADGAPMKHAF